MTLRLSGGRRLQSPPGDRARPTPARVRQAVFNMLAPRLAECRWLDLCCGSGVMACEALQRGAALVVGVEQDKRIAQVARSNLEALTRSTRPGQLCWQLHGQDVLSWLNNHRSKVPQVGDFDLIYCDPPYASGLYGPIAAAVAAGGWLAPGGLMLWECGTTQRPAVPEGWELEGCRRYGSTSVLLLSCRAGCRGDTDSKQP